MKFAHIQWSIYEAIIREIGHSSISNCFGAWFLIASESFTSLSVRIVGIIRMNYALEVLLQEYTRS